MPYVHGIFNAEKCITYLRAIGVEIDAATEAQWLDAQRSHRFLASMKRWGRKGEDWWCTKGHQVFVLRVRGRRVKLNTCAICGAPFSVMATRWWELRDGTLHDLRPKDERWRALDWTPAPFGDEPPPNPFWGIDAT